MKVVCDYVMGMGKVGLLVRLEAKVGKEDAVEELLKSGLGIVLNEPGTQTWYAFKQGPTSFGIFDTFCDEEGRAAHLSGEVAKALIANASELLSQPPNIQMVDILAAK